MSGGGGYCGGTADVVAQAIQIGIAGGRVAGGVLGDSVSRGRRGVVGMYSPSDGAGVGAGDGWRGTDEGAEIDGEGWAAERVDQNERRETRPGGADVLSGGFYGEGYLRYRAVQRTEYVSVPETQRGGGDYKNKRSGYDEGCRGGG